MSGRNTEKQFLLWPDEVAALPSPENVMLNRRFYPFYLFRKYTQIIAFKRGDNSLRAVTVAGGAHLHRHCETSTLPVAHLN